METLHCLHAVCLPLSRNIGKLLSSCWNDECSHVFYNEVNFSEKFQCMATGKNCEKMSKNATSPQTLVRLGGHAGEH